MPSSEDLKSEDTLTDGEENGDMEVEADSDKEEPTSVQGQLGDWLHQLQALSEELESSRPLASMHARHDSFRSSAESGSAASKVISASSPSINALHTAKSPKPPPVPPKPPMDSYRYSMANMEDSADIDLDMLLSELYALESQLNNDSDDAFLGLSRNGENAHASSAAKSGTAPSTKRPGMAVSHASNSLLPPSVPAKPSLQKGKYQRNATTISSNRTHPASPTEGMSASRSHNSSGENGVANGVAKVQSSGGGESFCNNNSNRAQSPDNDSAFCDSSSMMSSESMQSSSGMNGGGLSGVGGTVNAAPIVVTVTNNGGGFVAGDGPQNGIEPVASKRNRRSNASSSATDDTSRRDSITTPSPTQAVEPIQSQIRNIEEEIKKENLSEEEKTARLKAEKIKLALQKMKEASVKKLYVKIFTPNGSSKSILVDEQWTVAYALHQLAEKHLIPLKPTHAVVEHLPDLFMERIYEDHEQLVENLLLWTRESPNKLYFVERPDKYHLFIEPQRYLLDTLNMEKQAEMDAEKKEKLIEEFFSLSRVQPPEVEGTLYLKADGKKAWKKHHFVLRASGLYYVPKGKLKGSKDLVCLMNLEMVQVYNGLGWKKKYKAPTDFGFALKHPQIQVKASTYIKYLCAEDERSYLRWMTGLRLAKSGRAILENYQAILEQTGGQCNGALLTSEGINNSAHASAGAQDSYCKESVVLRPSRTAAGCTAIAPHVSPVLLRPRSADIGRASLQKRGSRTLTHVDIPALPSSSSESSAGTKFDPSPETPRRTAAASVNSFGAGGYSEPQTPTPDSQSMTGFDSEFSTGTIKRQPAAAATMPCKMLQPYAANHHGARLPLTESTKHIHLAAVLRKQRCATGDRESTSGGGSGSSRSLNVDDAMDSDEEAPPPIPTPHAMSQPPSFSTLQVELAAAAEFPPPPSPLPRANASSDSRRGTPSPKPLENGDTTAAPPSLVIPPSGSAVSPRLSPVSPAFINDLECKLQANGKHPTAQTGHQDGSRTKKVPPAPPKRAEHTRLTSTTPGTTPKPKPAVPAKPKLLPAPAVNNVASSGSRVAPPSPSHRASPQQIASSNDDTLSNAFQNELQRAMQRRLQKMEGEGGQNAT